MTRRLTIVLTLKDRSAFTRRWMRYMNDRRCPYRIVIADGGADAGIEAELRDRSRHPHLDYEYLRCARDDDYAMFHRKLADAIDRVATPYTLLADNDDFPLLDPVETFCDVLDADPAVESCGGQRYVLRVLGADGSLTSSEAGFRYEGRLDQRPRNVIGDSASARIAFFFRHVLQEYLWGAWYAVHRTDALRAAFAAGRTRTFRDPVTHEAHTHIVCLARGSYQQLPVPAYVIQAGSSQLTSTLEAQGNIVERFAATNAIADLQTSIDELAPPLTPSERQDVMQAIDAWLAATAERASRPPLPPMPKPAVMLPFLEPYILTKS